MKKLKKLTLIMVVAIGTLIFAGCGGDSGNPNDVADKFMNGMFKEELKTEEDKKVLKDLIHPDYSEEEKNEILDEYSITALAKGLFTESDRKEMKEFGIEGKMDELIDGMKKSIKVERLDGKEDGDEATIKYKISMPKINEDKLDDELEKVAEKIQKDMIDGKLKLDEGMKEIMLKAIEVYIDELENQKEFDDEEGDVQLKKVNGKWYVSDII